MSSKVPRQLSTHGASSHGEIFIKNKRYHFLWQINNLGQNA